MIIDQGKAKADNHILKGDNFLLLATQECKIQFVIPNFYTNHTSTLCCACDISFYCDPREIVKKYHAKVYGNFVWK